MRQEHQVVWGTLLLLLYNMFSTEGAVCKTSNKTVTAQICEHNIAVGNRVYLDTAEMPWPGSCYCTFELIHSNASAPITVDFERLPDHTENCTAATLNFGTFHSEPVKCSDKENNNSFTEKISSGSSARITLLKNSKTEDSNFCLVLSAPDGTALKLKCCSNNPKIQCTSADYPSTSTSEDNTKTTTTTTASNISETTTTKHHISSSTGGGHTNTTTGQQKNTTTGQQKDTTTGQQKNTTTGQQKNTTTGQQKDTTTGQQKDTTTGQQKDITTGQQKDTTTGQQKDTTTGQQKQTQKNFPVAAVAGGIGGGLAFVIIIGSILFCCRKKSHHTKYEASPSQGKSNGGFEDLPQENGKHDPINLTTVKSDEDKIMIENDLYAGLGQHLPPENSFKTGNTENGKSILRLKSVTSTKPLTSSSYDNIELQNSLAHLPEHVPDGQENIYDNKALNSKNTPKDSSPSDVYAVDNQSRKSSISRDAPHHDSLPLPSAGTPGLTNADLDKTGLDPKTHHGSKAGNLEEPTNYASTDNQLQANLIEN